MKPCYFWGIEPELDCAAATAADRWWDCGTLHGV